MMLKDSKQVLEYLEKIESKGVEILTDRQKIIAIDQRRNDDRMGMRAAQKEKGKKVWMNIGPLLMKIPAEKAEELLTNGWSFLFKVSQLDFLI